MKIKTILFLAVLLLLSAVKLQSAIQNAYVDFDYSDTSETYVNPFLFGTFIEYFMSFQNGYTGLWAQELANRGFDIGNYGDGLSPGWFGYGSPWDKPIVWDTPEGGYNENALRFQKITTTTKDGRAGIGQRVHVTDELGLDCYFYARGDKGIEDVKILIIDINNSKILYEHSFGAPGPDWKKYSVRTDFLPDQRQVNFVIAFTGAGSLDIDEASVMPSNNIGGFRKEFYDYYKKWHPTILRYPGGWFVEYSGYKWEMGVGPIDKRHVYKGSENVRMDFGIDEYMRFCEELGIDKHMVVNFLTGTPETSAACVEYCNGSTDTRYGKLRAANGHPKPYNVKIWEIGNEVWDDIGSYGKGFTAHYKAMKAVDPGILCIISGNIWQSQEEFDSVMQNIGDTCDIYGWHWVQPAKNKTPIPIEDKYLSMLGGSQQLVSDIDKIQDWLADIGLQHKLTQAVTEIWSEYNPYTSDWMSDTTRLGSSLLNGLWMAAMYNSLIRNADLVNIVERTVSVSMIRTEDNPKTGERVIYATPPYYICSLFANHSGTTEVPMKVSCGDYSSKRYPDLFYVENVPWLDVSATRSGDTLYLYLLNRHPTDTLRTFLDFPIESNNNKIEIYEQYSNSYQDANTIYEPNKVTYSEKTWNLASTYLCKPHSFTILAIPLIYINNIPVNESSNKILISPNPAGEYTRIISDKTARFRAVRLYDIMGNLIKEYNPELFNESMTFDLRGISSGSYYFVIESDNNIVVKPFIKLMP